MKKKSKDIWKGSKIDCIILRCKIASCVKNNSKENLNILISHLFHSIPHPSSSLIIWNFSLFFYSWSGMRRFLSSFKQHLSHIHVYVCMHACHLGCCKEKKNSRIIEKNIFRHFPPFVVSNCVNTLRRKGEKKVKTETKNIEKQFLSLLFSFPCLLSFYFRNLFV